MGFCFLFVENQQNDGDWISANTCFLVNILSAGHWLNAEKIYTTKRDKLNQIAIKRLMAQRSISIRDDWMSLKNVSKTTDEPKINNQKQMEF